MKILFINESTRIKGGVDYVVKEEILGLRKRGFEVDLFEFSHEEYSIDNMKRKIQKTLLYFSEHKKINIIKEKINYFKPDIVHFHNTYPFFKKPLWTDNIFKDIKVVQHLHNYYPFCLNSFFYRDENICTDCFDNNNFSIGIKNACYDYSKIKSKIVAFNRPLPSEWLKSTRNVDMFLGVSQFIVDKYIEFGVDNRKIKKLYNGVSFEDSQINSKEGSYILFLGNIVNSKGVTIVCELAKINKEIQFKIAGLGRDLSMLKEKYKSLSNLSFEGYVEGKYKSELIRNCRFLLFPVLSWEAFGLVILEATSFGKLIVTSGLGGTAEIVEEGINGYLVKDNDINRYNKVIRNLWWNFVNYPSDARKLTEILVKFSKKNHIENLINLYKLLF
ncbi:MAG: glycosyltransferase family 4 protein [Bacteroidetes bacterium]|nr:glycosyltransferase family 4 protein [Bacteroidota bacterium]MBU1114775.1 glycosyltransferase family 4 protein [Bacteroidota bacterium]MBU1799066.1 glycosyltransferase family 4 protein [Bacteroidota bacterium]